MYIFHYVEMVKMSLIVLHMMQLISRHTYIIYILVHTPSVCIHHVLENKRESLASLQLPSYHLQQPLKVKYIGDEIIDSEWLKSVVAKNHTLCHRTPFPIQCDDQQLFKNNTCDFL